MFFENYLCNSFEAFDVLAMELLAVMLFLKRRSYSTRQISMKHLSETEVFSCHTFSTNSAFPCVYSLFSRCSVTSLRGPGERNVNAVSLAVSLETGDTYYDLDEIIFEMKKRTF